MISKNTEYIPRLDHLRFIAATLVVAYHFAYPTIPPGSKNPFLLFIQQGYNGVSLFMVLSGFILTKICLHKEVDYRSFMFNRLLRIYPLYMLIVIAAAFSARQKVDFVSFVALASFMGNLGGVMPPRFSHIWTIMVEFQFYLLFPFIVKFFSRYGLRYIAGLIGVTVLLRTVIYLGDGTVQDAAYWTILGRLDQFAVGMVTAAVYLRWPSALSSSIWMVLSCGALLGWVYAFNRWCGGYYGAGSPHSTSVAWVVGPTVEAIAYGIVVLAYLRQKWRVPALLDKTLAYLGTISYSIYIWQLPIILLFRQYFPQGPFESVWLSLLLAVLPVTITVSILSYSIIEKPFFSMRTVYVHKSTSL